MANFDWHAERSDLGGIALLDRAPESEGIDLGAVRRYRQGRVRSEMAKRGVDAVILSDPINIRYATGTRNMQVFSMRNAPARYLVLTAHRSILFEFTGCEHLGQGYETVDEVRPAKSASFVAAGPDISHREKAWAGEMASLIAELTSGPGGTVGVERLNAGAAIALRERGLRIVDAQQAVEMARAIKSPEEMKCVNASLRATEIAVGKLRDAIRPGMTENELWSVLHKSVIEQNGDYCETRLLTSGQRTNPWFQETASSVIGTNELVALDTDVVGCHGYYSDFSRTFHSGPDKPTEAQKTLYKTAIEQVYHNMGILKAGMTFREYADKAWNIPDKYFANRYYLSAHGCGMTGEYPYLYHRGDFPDAGYDGVIEAGMTICVESYIGEVGGTEGVKLEQQVLITETGIEVLSHFPFEEDLMDNVHFPNFPLPTIGARQAQEPVESAGANGPDISRVVELVTEQVAKSFNAANSSPWIRAGSNVKLPNCPEKVDLVLIGSDATAALIAANGEAAIEAGLGGLRVAPARAAQLMDALRHGAVQPGICIGLPGLGDSAQSKAFEIRRAMRKGIRAVDLVIDVTALRSQEYATVSSDLAKMIDPTRESRCQSTVVLEAWTLSDEELVIGAKLAARYRPDVIATSLGAEGDSATPRQIELIREAVGKRPLIRATLGADATDAGALFDAGADRLGMFGTLVNL